MAVIVCRPGEGETVFDEPRRTLRLLVDREELTVTWFRYAPGEQGPDPHVHRRHTDAFYVLEGEVEFARDDGALRGGPGTWLSAPPGTPHGFRNPGVGRARVLNLHTPDAGFAAGVRG